MPLEGDANKCQQKCRALVDCAGFVRVGSNEARELLKKTFRSGASGSGRSNKAQRQAAVVTLRGSYEPRVDLLAAALRGGKGGFGRSSIKLIDELTAL